MNSVYELIKLGDPINADDPDTKDRVDHLNAKRALAERIGLATQGHLLAAEIDKITKPGLDMDPLSDDEVAIWRAFLPTSYRGNPTSRRQGGPIMISDHSRMSQYGFDRIPHPVLERLDHCLQKGLFESYEIWTPEEQHIPDPMLVGILAGKFYTLARWAESDSNLVTLASIKREMFAKWFINGGPAAMFTCFVASCMFAFIWMLAGDAAGSMAVFGHHLLWMQPVAAVLFLVYARSHWVKSDLQQAIWRDTKAKFGKKDE
jgi:hypothetical protein